MNKKTVIGLILMLTIFIGFSWYNQTEITKKQQAKALADSIANVEAQRNRALQQAVQTQSTESISQGAENNTSVSNQQPAMLNNMSSTLVSSLTGQMEYYTLENDNMIVTISNKGGAIRSVELKDYKTFDGTPLMLFNKENSEFTLKFFTQQDMRTSDFYFQPVGGRNNIAVTGEGNSDSLSMRLYLDTNVYIEYTYSIGDNDLVGFNVKFVGTDKIISPAQNTIALNWSNNSPRQERGFDYENQYTTIAYKYPNTNSIEEADMSTESKNEDIQTKVKWIAFKQQFFSSILVAKDDFVSGDLGFQTLKPESGYIKHFYAKMNLPYTPQTEGYNFEFYFGPNKYSSMKSYNQDFQELIPLGWSLFRWITRFIIIPTFNFLGSFISDYGIIILLLTIFIKIIIFPFTYKSYLSMAKMRLIKPEVDALSEKYPKKEDAMKKQQAMMELYRRAGVNPMGGCLPMLFQLPIIIAMFRFFPASIELRGESFLWATDLSSYDSILSLPFNIPFYGDHVSLFAILMAASMYLTSRLNMQDTAGSTQQMPGMKFMMLYFMPVMLLVWFNNYSSGLCYYYFLTNVITIIQTYAIRRVVNEDKLHARMKENAKKPAKKSKFQQKMDDMVRQQQEAQRQQQKRK